MYKPKRPGPVTAAAVLFFIFGSLGLVGSICTLGFGGFLASFLSNPTPPAPGQPNFYELWTMADARAPSFKYYFFIGTSIGLLLCLVEVIAGFGLLKMRYWGRNLGIFYGFASVLIAIAGTAYGIVVLNPAMKLWQQDLQKWAVAEAQKAAPKGAGGAGGPPPAPPPMAASNPVVDAMGSVFGAIVNLTYPIIILVLLMLPKVRLAFAIANGDAPPPEDDDDDLRLRDRDRDRDRDLDSPSSRQEREEPREPREDDYRYRSRPE